MSELFRRLSFLLNRGRRERELQDEMEFHREMAAREGSAPFGNSLRLREEARDAWGWTWIERAGQDIRYAARKLRQSPGFTLAAILTLAIGIGVNVAAFGFLNLMVLRPLPVRNPSSLLRFKRHAPQNYASQMPYPEVDFFREYSKTLSAVIALTNGKLNLENEDKPIAATFVTANYFSELGTVPKLGRVFDPFEDGAANSQPVVVLSYGFWQRHFGADQQIAGKTIRLNNKPATLLGVASEEFSGLSADKPDIWIPINQQPYFITGSQLLRDYSVDALGVTMFGRLKLGMTSKAVESELASLAAELRKQHPEGIWEKESLPSLPGGYMENVGGGRHGTGKEAPDEARPVIAIAAALGLLILAVACGNLGSLLLARGIAREREMTIRSAVGAGSRRLIRQLFTESLVLAFLGSAAGLTVGYFLLRSLMTLSGAPGWLKATPDWRVVLFAIATGVLAAILFGLAPAVQVARQRHRATWMRQVLIGGQVMASCVLVIVSALLARALDRALTAYPGFEYEQIVSIDPGLAGHGYSPAQARAYLETLQNRLRQLPGIRSVAMTSAPPLGNKKVTTGADVKGRSLDVHMYAVDPEFFKTMSIPLLAGRNLARGDTQALIISKSLADQWPTSTPLGGAFQMGNSSFTVVGVSGSARLVALQDAEAVEAYYLAGETDLASMVVVLKAVGPPEGLLPFVGSIARSVDPRVMPEVQLMKSSFKRKMEGAQNAALTVGVLGFAALMLASLGIVGLVSYAISQRRKEIGIRMALGANRAQVLLLGMTQLTRPVCVGLVLGVGGAAALSQLLRHQLYGVSNLDPVSYVASICLFSVAVLAAAVLPARRALRVDPATSLRCE